MKLSFLLLVSALSALIIGTPIDTAATSVTVNNNIETTEVVHASASVDAFTSAPVVESLTSPLPVVDILRREIESPSTPSTDPLDSSPETNTDVSTANSQFNMAWIHVKLGDRDQQVGLFSGPRMYTEMHRCLGRLCFGASGSGPNDCSTESCQINNVAFTNNGGLFYSGHLSVKVLEAAFPPFAWHQRDALLDLAAFAYQAQTEQDENCELVWANRQQMWMCRVGEFVSIDVGNVAMGGKLKVSVKFWAPRSADGGKRDCKTARNDIYDYVKNTVELPLAKELNLPFGFERAVYCDKGWW